MLVRVALIVLLLSGLFVAGHFGMSLPWDLAATTPDTAHEDVASKERDAQTSPDGSKNTSTPQSAIEETTAALTGQPGSEPPKGSVAIDISRISPDGMSVIAGRAEPDSYVTVLESGKPAATVKTDENGEFSIATEHKFASNDPQLSYEVSKTPPAMPEPAKPEPKVARAEPAKPSAAAVASEVMRKFENLVSQAREEAAKKTDEAKNADDEPAVAAKEPELKVEPDSKTASNESAASTVSPSASSQTAPEATADEPSRSTSAPPATAHADAGKSASQASSATASRPDTATAAAAPVASSRTDVIPVPIMFVYNEATLTSEGRRAADLLLEYLTLKHLKVIELTGHADERGTNEYNYDLSRERLEAVSQILKSGGYTGELTLTPKGKTEPYMGVDRSAYTGEALYQLDRRVELRVKR